MNGQLIFSVFSVEFAELGISCLGRLLYDWENWFSLSFY